MIKLTKKQKITYLKNPNFCPFCKNNNLIRTDEIEAEGNQAWSNIACNRCGKEWIEIFTISDVEVIQHQKR